MRYRQWIGRAALALIFLLKALGVVDQTRPANELAAHARRKNADLVEQDGPVISELEPTEPPLRRSGERALSLTEEPPRRLMLAGWQHS